MEAFSFHLADIVPILGGFAANRKTKKGSKLMNCPDKLHESSEELLEGRIFFVLTTAINSLIQGDITYLLGQIPGFIGALENWARHLPAEKISQVSTLTKNLVERLNSFQEKKESFLGSEIQNKIWNTRNALVLNGIILAPYVEKLIERISSGEHVLGAAISIAKLSGFAAISTATTLSMKTENIKRRILEVGGYTLMLSGTTSDFIFEFFANHKIKVVAAVWVWIIMDRIRWELLRIRDHKQGAESGKEL